MIFNLRDDIDLESYSLFDSLGSYWTAIFQDAAVLKTIVDAVEDISKQGDINFKEQLLTADLANSPVWHTQLWYRLRIYKTGLLDGYSPLTPKYGESYSYGTSGIYYGRSTPYLYTYKAPSTLVEPGSVTNSIQNPTYIAYENSGYYYAPGYIGFEDDPFNNPLFPIKATDSGQAIDLWLYMSKWDTRLLQNRYALALAINASTSKYYRSLLEGSWQARFKGASRNSLYKILEGCSGVPTAKASETVLTSLNGIITTTKNVYVSSHDNALDISVGDKLHVGSNLFSSLEVVTKDDLNGRDISIPSSFFEPTIGITGSITFPNRTVDVEYEGTTSEGNTKVRIPLEGSARDLQNYWKYADDNGFCHAVDKRGINRTTEPSSSDLKSTINPAVDLIAKLMQPNMVLVVTEKDSWNSDISVQKFLEKETRSNQPPHGAVIFNERYADISSSYSSQSESSSSSSTEGSTQSSLSSPSSLSDSSLSSLMSSSSQSAVSTSSVSISSLSSSSLSSVSSSSVSESSDTSSSVSSSSSQSAVSSSSSSEQSRSSLSSESSSSESSSSSSSRSSSSSSSSTDTSSSGSTDSSSSSSTVADTASSNSSSSSTLHLSTSSSSRSSFTMSQSTQSESSKSESSISETKSSQSSHSSHSTASARSESSGSNQTDSSTSLSTSSSVTDTSSSSNSEVSHVSASSKSESSKSESSITVTESSLSSASSASSKSKSSNSDVSFSSGSSRSESSKSDSSVSDVSSQSESSVSDVSSQSESTVSSESSDSSESSVSDLSSQSP